MPNPDPEAFAGWCRRGKGEPWVRVCCAITRELCLRLLLDHQVEGAKVVDKVVLPRGSNPNRKRRCW